jgi:hypothetical protein
MSYDLMVFDPLAPPFDREGFIDWYRKQTEWTAGHSYDDAAITTPALRAWFMEMISQYPPMNGPYAPDDTDNLRLTDYSIGKSIIYAAFAWSEADSAFRTMFNLAQKHRVGFFDVSSDEGGVWLPDAAAGLSLVHGGGMKPGSLQ